MAYVKRKLLLLRAYEELEAVFRTGPRPASACDPNPCGASNKCTEGAFRNSPEGSYTCCGPEGAISCYAVCPPNWTACSGACCPGTCSGTGPSAECNPTRLVMVRAPTTIASFITFIATLQSSAGGPALTIQISTFVAPPPTLPPASDLVVVVSSTILAPVSTTVAPPVIQPTSALVVVVSSAITDPVATTTTPQAPEILLTTLDTVTTRLAPSSTSPISFSDSFSSIDTTDTTDTTVIADTSNPSSTKSPTKPTSKSGSSRSTPSSSSSSNTNSTSTLDPTSTPLGNDIDAASNSGLFPTAKIAIGVTVPLVFILAILGLLLFLYKKRKAKTAANSPSAPELDGSSRVGAELEGGKFDTVHEVGGNELVKAAVLVTATSEVLDEKKANVWTPTPTSPSRGAQGQGQELRDQYASGATLYGPPTFELADNEAMRNTSTQEGIDRRSELSSSPISGHSRDFSTSSFATTTGNRVRSPIQRKELPATPVMRVSELGERSQSPIIGGVQGYGDDGESESERLALEQRRAKIAAEKEHLRRMRELDEEESHIDLRLNSLGRARGD